MAGTLEQHGSRSVLLLILDVLVLGLLELTLLSARGAILGGSLAFFLLGSLLSVRGGGGGLALRRHGDAVLFRETGEALRARKC